MTGGTTRTVTLHYPLERKGDTAPIATVALAKPTTGTLRGLSLMSLMQMEVTALATLLPRITQPALMPEDVAALDPVDLMLLAGEVMGFFMPPGAVEALGLPNR